MFGNDPQCRAPNSGRRKVWSIEGIKQPLQPVPGGPPTSASATIPNINSSDEMGSSGFTSQGATLSEIRDQTRVRKPHEEPSSKKKKKTRNVSQRSVPMPAEFFRKIGWTRSFISGPADLVHNPLMVWCHICKRNFSIKAKGTLVRYYAIIEVKIICAETRGGVTNTSRQLTP